MKMCERCKAEETDTRRGKYCAACRQAVIKAGSVKGGKMIAATRGHDIKVGSAV